MSATLPVRDQPMKYHAEFFNRSTSTGDYVQAVGDRSVIILDGRNTSDAMHAIAADECKKRGFVAYRINKGARFTQCVPVTRIVDVSSVTDLQTASKRGNA